MSHTTYVALKKFHYSMERFDVFAGDILVLDASNHNNLTVMRDKAILRSFPNSSLQIVALRRNGVIEEVPSVVSAPVADTPAEEPKAEEPKAEEPKAEEPKAEEPKAEEPKAEEHAHVKEVVEELVHEGALDQETADGILSDEETEQGAETLTAEEGLSKEELVAKLKELNIKHHPNAGVKKLAALLEGAQAGTVTEEAK